MRKLSILPGLILLVMIGSLSSARAAESTAWWAVFVSNREGNHRLYQMGPDGKFLGDFDQKTSYHKGDYRSPDGDWLVLDLYRDGNWETFRRRFDGSTFENITRNPAEDSRAVWSPDGQWIIFESDRDGNRELYRVRPDGSDVHNLTNNTAFDCCVVFRPMLDGIWHPQILLILAGLAILAGFVSRDRINQYINRA